MKTPGAFAPSTAEMIEEIAASPVEAVLLKNGIQERVFLSLPYDCKFGGSTCKRPSLDGSADREQTVGTMFLRVNDQVRGHGIGKRLVSALVGFSVEWGATDLSALVVSQYSHDILTDLLGEDSATYSDTDQVGVGIRLVTLPMTDEQARSSLVRAEAFETDLDNREHGLIETFDLTRFNGDASGFEPTVLVDRRSPTLVV